MTTSIQIQAFRLRLSLGLPTVSVAAPSIPLLSLNLPPETCTPGFSPYATPGLDGHVPANACNAPWVYHSTVMR